MSRFRFSLCSLLLVSTLASWGARAEERPASPEAPAAPPALTPGDLPATSPATDTPAPQDSPAQRPDPATATETDADLWDRVRAGFRIPEGDQPAVKAQERFYASKPEYMRRVVERSRRYLYFIVSEVERRSMPTELALLPIVESAFVPKAQSHAMASGLWQFIPSTGKRYGLERTWWYDGRQDVMAATYAALDYLQDLYNMFGDWQLALAAYNWGEGSVERALSKTRARGLDDSFDSIKKPKETENYVPKLLAIRNIIANPAAFGIVLPTVPNRPYFQPVAAKRHIDLELAARLAETTVEEILHLNPGLIRPVFAAKEERKLLLPVEKAAVFTQNLETYDQPLLSWQPYVTRRGEVFSAIAERFDIPLGDLRDINKLGAQKVASGQTILVPLRPDGDVAERQNLAALMVGAAAKVQAGHEEAPTARKVSVPVAAPAPAATPLRHKLARGESLAAVAKRYGTTPAALMKANGLRSSRVAAGTSLIVPAAAGRVSPQPVASRPLPGKSPAVRLHVVRRGETLEQIAKRHAVTVADLKRWNTLPTGKGGSLKVGAKLEIRKPG